VVKAVVCRGGSFHCPSNTNLVAIFMLSVSKITVTKKFPPTGTPYRSLSGWSLSVVQFFSLQTTRMEQMDRRNITKPMAVSVRPAAAVMVLIGRRNKIDKSTIDSNRQAPLATTITIQLARYTTGIGSL
jgi:hypothetical protein